MVKLKMRYRYLPALVVLLLAASLSPAAGESEQITCDVCVVGGGSGGYGAALAAARAGAKVILVEKQPILGGTSTSAFVTNWEPGPGCSFSRELYEHLKAAPQAVAIAPRVHRYKSSEPYGLSYGTPKSDLTYDDTLRRAGAGRKCSVVMKPDALARAMAAILKKAGVRILFKTTFKTAETSRRTVRSIRMMGPDGRLRTIVARVFIDSTGGAHLCRAIGCEIMLGSDPRSRFNEPSAPEKGARVLNAISLCYRIQKAPEPKRAEVPVGEVGSFAKTAFISGVSDRELIVNPLGLVPGSVLVDKGYPYTMALARRRAGAHWRWLQGYPYFKQYELKDIAPRLGIRESYRTVTEYVLTQQDLATGLAGQKHTDIIAIADHPMDTHGRGGGLRNVRAAYGVPYRCLIPKGFANLLVACRGAGFSHIAASSCRLSRTMIALGHAAGVAAAEAARNGKNVRKIDIPRLVRSMGVAAIPTKGK
jgi:hypothetical protein